MVYLKIWLAKIWKLQRSHKKQTINYRNNLDRWTKKIWMIPAECVLTYLRKQLAIKTNMEFTVTGYESWHFHLLSVWSWKSLTSNFILDIMIPAIHRVVQMWSHMSKQIVTYKITLKWWCITISWTVFHMILSKITLVQPRRIIS